MARNRAIKYLAKYAAQAANITAKYQDYKLGKNQPKVKAPSRGASVRAALAPFDTKSPEKTMLVKASGRAMKAETRTATGATDAILNIESGTIPDAARRKGGFKPAKVVIFVPEQGIGGEAAPTQAPEDAPSAAGTGSADDTSATPISRVTGLEYKRRLGNSYTYPFGSSATAGQDKEEGMMNYLYNKLATGGKSLSFHSEESVKPTKK